MPRPRRIHYEGAVYHVTSRGNERRRIFLDDKDRWVFLRLLEEVIREEGVLCHAWVLMDNHYHLLLETPGSNLSRAMWHLNGLYTQRFNKRHERVGHLFQGRFKAIVVEKETYLQELCRYVVLNPVRARMVKAPGDWKWSSYRATAGLDRKENWLEIDWILSRFGRGREQAQRAYRKFVAEGVGQKVSPWEELRSRVYLGSEVFLDHVQDRGKEQRGPDIPKYQRSVVRQSPQKVLAKVGAEFGLDPAGILRRGSRKSEGRAAAIYLLRQESGLSLREIGIQMGVGFSAVGNQWARVKRRMEQDPGFARRVLKCKM
ncbi:MAG TPA: transposase [bacterium]|nr:transposase [bacterium]